MFIQIIRAPGGEPAALRERHDAWREKLLPGAEGFLGSTAGITSDGKFILLARFRSAEDARRNSDRPEQSAWWAETEAALRGEVTFAETSDVDVLLDGGSDDAGFVQVMVGTASDPAAVRALDQKMSAGLRDVRPEVIGGFGAWLDDGRFVQAIYFTSEEEARAGESSEMPQDVAEAFAEMQEAATVDEYLDITDPWFISG